MGLLTQQPPGQCDGRSQAAQSPPFQKAVAQSRNPPTAPTCWARHIPPASAGLGGRAEQGSAGGNGRMPLPRRRSSFLGQQPSSTAAESSGPPGRRLSIGSLARPPGVYVGTVPTGGVSSLGTRVSRRALGISSVFLQGLRSSAATVPLAPGLEKGRALSYETLNSCLVEYIEKVRALEQVNQELEEHIRVYLDKKAASVGSWGALRENWEAIYHQVGTRALSATEGTS